LIAASYLYMIAAESSVDGVPIPSFFGIQWDVIGGWSLFIGLCLLIVVGAFREWWVPGGRYRRLETSAAEQSKTLATTVDALREQTQANEITKHFFEKTVPKRGEPSE
jgi:hypothetical protein